MNNLTAFMTGLGTGGLTCLAVQGGLLIGLLAKQHEADEQKARTWQRLVLPVSGFLLAKLAVYTLFGFVLGLLGAKFQLSSTAQAWLQGLAALFMIVTGIRIIWPSWLPWLAITPPASVRRVIRRSAKSELLAAPIILGALTIFIPCGTTLAVEAAALATGHALPAAGIVFFFILGTMPLFFVIGVLAKGSSLLQSRLKYVTALLVICTGIYSFNAMLNSVDSPFSFRNVVARAREIRQRNIGGASVGVEATTTPTINVYANGYQPTQITVPAGQQIKVLLNAPGPLSCTSIFRIPKLGIQKQLAPNSNTSLSVTFPQPGSYTYTCGMGMYSGTITAI